MTAITPEQAYLIFDVHQSNDWTLTAVIHVSSRITCYQVAKNKYTLIHVLSPNEADVFGANNYYEQTA
jgi:hypothetical protein